MIAIHTKHLGPTNTRGSRVKAYTQRGFSVVIPYPYECDTLHAHFEAVQALVKKYNLEWDVSTMVHGTSADGLGYCFCFPKSLISA